MDGPDCVSMIWFLYWFHLNLFYKCYLYLQYMLAILQLYALYSVGTTITLLAGGGIYFGRCLPKHFHNININEEFIKWIFDSKDGMNSLRIFLAEPTQHLTWYFGKRKQNCYEEDECQRQFFKEHIKITSVLFH